MEDKFSEILEKIKTKTKDEKIINVLEKMLNWELSRSDMDRPTGAVDDFRCFINDECNRKC